MSPRQNGQERYAVLTLLKFDGLFLHIVLYILWSIFITDSSLLSDIAYVLCLDSLGVSDNVRLHVSKPPREDTPGGELLQVSTQHNFRIL